MDQQLRSIVMPKPPTTGTAQISFPISDKLLQGGVSELDSGSNFFNLNSASICHLDDVNNLRQLTSNYLHNYFVNVPNLCGGG